jgi:tetratricopeptide (TPR) repeat protein
MTARNWFAAAWKPLLIACGLVGATLFAFSPAFPGPWLWDDNREIPLNPILRDPDGLAKIWLHPTAPDPVKATLEWLGWGLWGDSPFGFHVASFALHLLSVFLVWRLFAQLGLRGAWAGALLFGVHPLAVESVAWIVELKNTTSLPFLLGAMLAWLAYDRTGSRRSYAIALAAFAAALLCKSSVLMFPPVLLLHAWWKRGRVTRADVIAVVPFGVLALGMALLTAHLQEASIEMVPGSVAMGGFFSRLACSGLAVSFYLLKFLFPVALVPIYPLWRVDPPDWFQFLPWLFIGALLVWFWRRRAGWGRHALLAFGFFLLYVVPASGVVPLTYFRIAWVADHLVYIGLIGLAGGATAAAGAAFRKWAIPAPVRMTVAVLAIAVLALASRLYAERFSNPEELWAYNVEMYPNVWMAQNNLGVALAKRGDIQDAVTRYQIALRLNDSCEEAHNNLGVELVHQGHLDEAIAQFKAALAINPAYPSPRWNLERLKRLAPEAKQ